MFNTTDTIKYQQLKYVVRLIFPRYLAVIYIYFKKAEFSYTYVEFNIHIGEAIGNMGQ